MIDSFLELIKQYTSPTDEEIAFLKKNITIKSYPKNKVFFEEGSIAKSIYFVLKGCVRLFYNVDGNDKTAYFYTEGKFICADESYLNNTPAKENYQTIEDTTLVVLSITAYTEIYNTIPNFEIIERMAMADALITSNRIVESLITKSPEERYIELLETKMDLFQRVPQQYIATYLGISPQSLSRIRKRIAQKGK